MSQNIVNTTNGFYEDGQSWKAPYGDPGEPVINTKQVGFWMDGQTWLYPFQNTQSGGPVGRTMPIQCMIVTMTLN